MNFDNHRANPTYHQEVLKKALEGFGHGPDKIHAKIGLTKALCLTLGAVHDIIPRGRGGGVCQKMTRGIDETGVCVCVCVCVEDQ